MALAIGTVLDISAKEVVPPAERRGIVTNKSLVVVVMVLSASPERNPVVERPWEIVTRVSVNGLEETKHDPEQHGSQVKVPLGSELENIVSDQVIDQWATDSAKAQNHCLDGVSVFSSNTERCSVLVVDLVYFLVERGPVHESVHVIVVEILKDEKDGQLG